jgi:hypothetical protein
MTTDEPLCPVCYEPIRLGQPAALGDGALVHGRCFRLAPTTTGAAADADSDPANAEPDPADA